MRLGRRLHRIEQTDGPPPEPGGAAGYPPLRRGDHRRPGREPAALLGWFSAVHLNLHAWLSGEPAAAGAGHLRHVHRRHAGVPAREDRGFLAVMGLADEFTVERWPGCHRPARRGSGRCCGPSPSKTRCHPPAGRGELPLPPMMKECAERLFAQLPAARQRRSGSGMAAGMPQKPSTSTLCRPEHCGDRDAALAVIGPDAGICLRPPAPPSCCSGWTAAPVALQRHPLAILVLMRRMFTWQQIPK